MLRAVLTGYESFLKIDPKGKIKDLVHARALVWFGWTIILLLIANLVGMTYSYGRWTPDHTVAVSIIFIFLTIIHAVRYYRNYAVYGTIITILVVSGVFASALPDHTGINSALLPMLVIIPMLNGFISGPRITILTGAIMLGVIAVLYVDSSTHDVVGMVVGSVREFQRALQAGFVVIMATIVSAIFSTNIFRAFDMLEDHIIRVREAEAAKAQFLAAMSHELRTPLNGVLGLSEAMQKTTLTAEQLQLMQGIDSSGRSLMAIFDDIMNMLKIDARQIEISPHEFDLRVFIEGVVATWRSPAIEKGLALEAEVDHGAPQRLIGDEAHIRQIVAKIVSNAVKYTPKGSVSISAKVREETNAEGAPQARLEISVRDTGPGISEDAGEIIFNAFAQAESGSIRSQDGAGLGLAICQKLATLMHGEVTFHTEEGEGATFYLDIPIGIAATAEESARVETDAARENNLQGARVLVVEDNMINRMVAVRLLDGLGIDHATAEDGAKCLECLKNQSFDAILMDYHMPVMDGLEATKAIRAMDGPLSTIPIIACTADTMAGAREMLLAAGL